MGSIASSVTFCSSGPCPVLAIEEDQSESFRFYPNPATESVAIEVNIPGELFLKDAMGRLIETFEFKNEQTIRLDHLEDGKYFFVSDGWTERIVIEK